MSTIQQHTLDFGSAVSWWNTHMGEEEAQACAQAVRERCISRGPLTEGLEARFAHHLDVPGALCVPSGSMGLWLALMALDIGPGDEVIVPDLTWIATAHAASLLGARVVLVDCLPERPVLDPAAVAAAITPRTRAIMPVHLAGRAAPMSELRALCDEHGLHLVEDAAQAFHSRDAMGFLGTRSDAGVFSLGMAKLVSTGQGGVVVSRDERLLERMRRATLHGVAHGVGTETYLHRGFNMKFTDVQAALGWVQLDRLPDKAAHVRTLHERYVRGLADVEGVRVEWFDLDAGELPLWTEVRCEDRTRVRSLLEEQGIETHLPHRPLHEAEHLNGGGSFPHSERHADELLILPSGPSQPLSSVDRVVDALRAQRLAA